MNRIDLTRRLDTGRKNRAFQTVQQFVTVITWHNT